MGAKSNRFQRLRIISVLPPLSSFFPPIALSLFLPSSLSFLRLFLSFLPSFFLSFFLSSYLNLLINFHQYAAVEKECCCPDSSGSR